MPEKVWPFASRVTAPSCGRAPTRTSATSRTLTADPVRVRTTVPAMSSTPVSSPSPRTVSRSPRDSRKPPLNDWLLVDSASTTSCSVRPNDSSLDGSTSTSNARDLPPHEFTSPTPGTARSRVRISQS